MVVMVMHVNLESDILVSNHTAFIGHTINSFSKSMIHNKKKAISTAFLQATGKYLPADSGMLWIVAETAAAAAAAVAVQTAVTC